MPQDVLLRHARKPGGFRFERRPGDARDRRADREFPGGLRRGRQQRQHGCARLPRQLRGTLLGEALANLPVARAADLLGYVLGVANSLAVADGLPLSESESVPRALEKAVRGIDTGLRELARVRGQAPEEVLDRTAPLDLFRVGATVDPSLKERAS